MIRSYGVTVSGLTFYLIWSVLAVSASAQSTGTAYPSSGSGQMGGAGQGPLKADSATVLLLHLDGDTEDESSYRRGSELSLKGKDSWTSQGRFGKALTLTGGDQLSLAPELLNSNQGTIEMWIKLERWAPNENALLDYARHEPHGLLLAAGRKGWILYSAGMTPSIQTDQGPRLGEWHHVALSWDSNIRLFVDGKLLGSVSREQAGLSRRSAAWLKIGSIGPRGNDAYSLNGIVDEIRVSDEARYEKDFSASKP